MQVETQIGDYFVTYMVFPAFPRPGEPGRVNLYASRIDSGAPYQGKVIFKVRDDSWFDAPQELLGVQPPDGNVFRQGFLFKGEGDYIITAEFEVGGEPYVIDFPLRIGKPAPVGPLAIAAGLLFVVLVAVNLLQRKRLQRSKIRGAREEHRIVTMTHPGLPSAWGWAVVIGIVLLAVWTVVAPVRTRGRARYVNLASLPVAGHGVRWLTASPVPLQAAKLVLVVLFLLVIAAGLFGTPIPERNIATALTWNLWWTGLIIAVFFLGSAWCAVCPWDALATWLVRRRLWRRADPNNSLNLRVPKTLRNVWPALLLFIGLTWLELGVGVTTSPYATALLALLMVVLTTLSLAVFERKAFCRYFCPVGRTVGFYAQMAPVELRPVDPDVCARCETLECYHGSKSVDSCPTHLLMRSLTQNTYCTSCGNCTQSCPHRNISWRLRPPSVEAIQEARPHWDEAWFMLALLALTGFHGVTMMPFWEPWMSTLALLIGDSGQLLWSFSIGLLVSMSVSRWRSSHWQSESRSGSAVVRCRSGACLPASLSSHCRWPSPITWRTTSIILSARATVWGLSSPIRSASALRR